MPGKSAVTVNKTYIEKHKPYPSFEWYGPLENYYKDGECYYTVKISVVECCEGSAVSEVYGHGENSLKRACAELSENCDCGNTWHYFNQ